MARTVTDIEYKVVAGSAFKVDDGEPLGTIAGYLNKTGIIDSGSDFTVPGCFKQTIKDAYERREQEGGDQLWPLTWNHSADTIPPGSIVSAWENKNGLFIKARLNLDYDLGKNLYSAFRFGNVKGLSMGYHATDVAYRNDAASGKTVRDLKIVDIVEGAAVLFAMNKESYVTNVKSGHIWPGFSAEVKEGRSLSARTIGVLRKATSGIEGHVQDIESHLAAARQNAIAGVPLYSASDDTPYDIASAVEELGALLEGKEGRAISEANRQKISKVTQNIMAEVKTLKTIISEAEQFNRLAGWPVYGSSSSDELFDVKDAAADDPLVVELRELRESLAPSTRSYESRMDEIDARIGVNVALVGLLTASE
jgi:HK97 family phage prohead protease